MDREQDIRKIHKDLKLCEGIRMKLLLNGYEQHSPGVKMVDDRIWHLLVRLYILVGKKGKRKTQVLREFGINLN